MACSGCGGVDRGSREDGVVRNLDSLHGQNLGILAPERREMRGEMKLYVLHAWESTPTISLIGSGPKRRVEYLKIEIGSNTSR